MKKTKNYYENEFYRILDIIISQGEYDVIAELISFNTKKDVVDKWNEDNEAQEYKDFKRCAD